MREGKDITLVAFGKLVGYNLKAAEILAKDGIDAEVQRPPPPPVAPPAGRALLCRQSRCGASHLLAVLRAHSGRLLVISG